ncbi:MAG: sel1 repeat family protein [Acidobacteriota bacterium]|nr:sel1 repeat family protein [Acidobacteriota bacterium]
MRRYRRFISFSFFALIATDLRLAQATDVVMASGLVQKCLGIAPGADKITMPGPATQQYCRQLPGAELFDQARVRFQSGDHAGAAQMVRKAAEAGNVEAQLRFALMCDQGDGVARSSKAAFAWYSRAAAQGEPESQSQLGAYYELGEGVAENWDLAAKLWQASALQGWTKGQSAFGRAYQFGIGVPQNRQEAIAWFRKAAAQGNGKAEYFANWLRDPTNNIGYRDDAEHDVVTAGKLRFGASLIGADPHGITFHSSAQRAVWILGLRNRVDVDEAEVFRQIRKHEYDDCTRAGRDNCGFGRF